MDPACLIIAAHLCIPREYLAVVQRSVAFQVTKPANEKAVKRLGIRIYVHFQESDETKSPANLLNKSCDEKSCIYYHKHCSLRLSECIYSSGERVTEKDGKDTLRLERFNIEFSSWNDLLKAESRMHLAFGPRTKTSFVKLQVLEGSRSLFPPTCSTRDPGCEPVSSKEVPPTLPRL